MKHPGAVNTSILTPKVAPNCVSYKKLNIRGVSIHFWPFSLHL